MHRAALRRRCRAPPPPRRIPPPLRPRAAGSAGSTALLGLAAITVGLGALWLPGADDLVASGTGGRLFAAEAWELPASVATIVAAGLTLAGLRRPLTGDLQKAESV